MSDENEDVVVDIVRQIYAEDEDAAQTRIDRYCEKSLFEEAITFIPYIGPLLDSSCIAPDPPRKQTIEPRVTVAIHRIEDALQLKLDNETKENIRADIFGIWGAW
jgi:hypothetical protein